MEQVDIGIMLPGAELFNDQNVNPTWKGHVKTHEQIVVAFIKQLPPQKLYIECVCAVLGRYLGLPIPKPLVVKLTNDSFSDIPEGSYALAFGSEDASYPSFRRHAQSEEAMLKLAEFAKTLDVGLFDEWIANWDRNIGNILYDGGNEFSFIDHENAISEEIDFKEEAHANQIVDAIYSLKSEFEKYKINRQVQTSLLPQYQELPFSILSEKTYAGSYLSDEKVLRVINFLESRASLLHELFSKRLKQQQQEMAI